MAHFYVIDQARQLHFKVGPSAEWVIETFNDGNKVRADVVVPAVQCPHKLYYPPDVYEWMEYKPMKERCVCGKCSLPQPLPRRGASENDEAWSAPIKDVTTCREEFFNHDIFYSYGKSRRA